MTFTFSEAGQQEKKDANGYCTISEIKGGPAIGAEAKVQEIHYLPEPYPIGQVPHSPTQDKGQGKPVDRELNFGEVETNQSYC